jgi:subtilase family serine protease
VTDSARTTLTGNVSPFVQAKYDHGIEPDSTPTGTLTLVLKRSAQQESELLRFLAEAHRKDSANFHKWLKPGQLGQEYGPSDDDVAVVQSWLQSQGFSVAKVSSGKAAIQFSGTAGQVKTTFHTELHTYIVNGETHHANSTDPQIPNAVAPVISGILGLSDFSPKPLVKPLGKATYDPVWHKTTPQWTVPNSPHPYYALSPKDFATQYDLTPLYSAQIDGARQTIGIINESNIDLGQVIAYRKLFNLDKPGAAPNLPQVVIDGPDPGVNGSAIESYLDVEEAGALAPQATVKLYISKGLEQATLRAVSDDEASVLSLSFGGCEAALGASQMAFYNYMWEQAAAQGQTVMVSSGDSGSATCDDLGNPFALLGLQVNGLASTPWNIAVGGTDFYYSDYATGGASITNYWSQTNDSSYGSLLKPIPEQPWNGTVYGLNSMTGTSFSGGGGGESNCAVPGVGTDPIISTGYGDCANLVGYPKPGWQNGLGVPKDGVRDLPDVSLFAAAGDNYSFYPLCANPGDCVDTDLASGSLYFTGVGGTSASAPAFAAIMALVNQKYGPQGQANYVLYPLAAKNPAIFHDVTIGSNNMPCSLAYPPFGTNCSADATGGGFSLQDWPSTPGYDLASGLGSVDAAALINAWGSITFTPTTTTLEATPTSITHGQKMTLTAYVAPGSTAASNSSTPTGNVAIVTDSNLPGNSGQLALTLDATGTTATSIDYLPGGTYKLYAQYGGDGTFASSQSSPLSVTVNPENSTLTVTTSQFSSFPFGPITNGASFPYGSSLSFTVQPVGVDGVNGGSATGTVTFFDNGTALATLPLSAGLVTYTPQGLGIGNHSFTYSYSGDASYHASALNTPNTFSIVQPLPVEFSIGYEPGSLSLSAGASFTLLVSPCPQIGATVSPTGNVTVTMNSLTQTFTPVPPPVGSGFCSRGEVVFSNLAQGSYQFTIAYAGDSTYPAEAAQSVLGLNVNVGPANGLLPTTTTLNLTSPTDPSTIQPGTLVTVTATVTGSTAAPTGNVLLRGPELSGKLNPTAGGMTSTATFTFPAYEGNLVSAYPAGLLIANYEGDATYNTSESQVLKYKYSVPGDFTIIAPAPNLTISSGASSSVNLLITSVAPFSGNVTLTCEVTGKAASLPLCTLPASVTVTANGTISSQLVLQTSIPAKTSAAISKGWVWTAGGSTAFACLFLCGIPSRKRTWPSLLGLLLSAIVGSALISGCGGTSTPTSPTSPVNTLVPAGTYTAVVTASNGTSTHNVTLTILVQ